MSSVTLRLRSFYLAAGMRFVFPCSLLIGWTNFRDCAVESVTDFTTASEIFSTFDDDIWSVLTPLTGVQSHTAEIQGTTIISSQPVLGDNSLLRESNTVDVMEMLSFRIFLLMPMHIPSIMLSKTLFFNSPSVFVCLLF